MKKYSQETIDKIEEMLKQGVVRESIAVTLGVTLRDIRTLFKGSKYYKPSSNAGVPDPTPEEIEERKNAIRGWVSEPYYRYD